MKINVVGKGSIPGLRILAPIYNREVSNQILFRILTAKNLKVYESDTGLEITLRNFNTKKPVSSNKKKPTILSKLQKAKEVQPAVEAVMEPAAKVEEPVAVEEEVVETPLVAESEKETIVDDVIEPETVESEPEQVVEPEIPEVEEEETTEPIEEVIDIVDTASEDSVDISPADTDDDSDGVEEVSAKSEGYRSYNNQYRGKKKKNKNRG